MSKVVAIANQKGGVGKTTTTVNLAACVAQTGRRVLCVDLDPQGNATSGLGINKNETPYSMYNVIVEGISADEAKVASVVKGLDVLPARKELAAAEVEIVNMVAREMLLKRAIVELKEDYDYVFIDCPPSLGLLTINALNAADEIIAPIQCEYYALEGLADLMNTVRRVRNSLNPALEVGGVILTMFNARTKLSAQVVAEVTRYFKNSVFNTIIPRSIRLGEAPSFGLPITMYEKSGTGSKAYIALANEFLAKENG